MINLGQEPQSLQTNYNNKILKRSNRPVFKPKETEFNTNLIESCNSTYKIKNKKKMLTANEWTKEVKDNGFSS